MRIALDISGALAGPSGVRYYIEELLGGLARTAQGHEFVLFAAFWRDPGRLAELRLPEDRRFTRLFKRAPQSLVLPADEFLRLGLQERWTAGAGAGLFHGLGNQLPRLSRLPGVVTVHHLGGALDETGPWQRFYFDRLTESSARRADAVIAVSEFSRGEIVKAFGLNPERVVAVWEGGAAPEFVPQTSQGSAYPFPYLLAVGGVHERKNLEVVTRALARLALDRAGRDLRLVLAGTRGPHAPVLDRLIADLGLEGRVVFEGPVVRERLVRLYQGCAVFVFPSKVEGFGFPALEAMACGAPVVASRAGSLPEVAGPAAILVDPDDDAAWARELLRVLTDNGLAGELKREGFERVKRFSWDRAARETAAVYEQAVAFPQS